MSADAYVHEVAEGKPGAPVAFLFHGTGGDETQLLALGRDLAPDATLIAPRGDVDEGGAARFFRRTGEGRYDMADLARATAKTVAFVTAHMARRPGARAFGVGYSNGANILASAIFARRDLFAAAALLHPLIGWEPEPGAVATRVLIAAGERDPICPPPLTRQLIGWFRAQGAPTEEAWHGGGHGIAASEVEAARRFFARATVEAGAAPR